ncbi:hypothetical protein FIA58_000160 [Flavobacterium jejuense]|uniref:Baseplate protein J-like domain-containing protein n=1 Tax=Flavobacterium jejuense TaxID=1544455 RepID=A0ABX0IQF7_9FLAO|nr:baseplate J/gp47 family protein [Flavobacterium jejuense]NHN24075.1 hypothetical protein [Flavobacterium jejuense]
MINSLKSHNLLFRDGTSQEDRKTDAIQPDYIPVEERSMEQLIAEAQRLAKELHFFNTNNEVILGETWEAFLIDDPIVYNKEPEIGSQRRNLREQWANQLATYVEDPEHFLKDQEKVKKLSRPHLVLFMTFLKLLNYVKSQINGLTQKHLDFYFRERLGLTPKEAVPDVVHVLLELVENCEALEVKKGTVLLAGEDELGNELHYSTNENTIISQAKITQLKNIFVEKQFLTIKEVHINNENTEDLGLTSMMEFALGHPKPGDALPELPDGVNNLEALIDSVQKGEAKSLSYVSEQLFLSIGDFNVIIQKNQEEKEGLPVDWQMVYTTLDDAYKNKTKHIRQQELKVIHEEQGFDPMLKKVYGNPEPGDNLPLYQGHQASFNTIYDDLNTVGQNSDLALEYIVEHLKLKKEDFNVVIETSKNQNASQEDWKKVYCLLEFADRQIRSVILSSPSIEKFSDIYATSDATAFTFSQYGEEEESKRFKTFGNKVETESDQELQPATIGFAISSPTLLVKEGKRTISTLLDLGLQNVTIDNLETIFDKKTPFKVQLSTNNKWFTPEKVSFTLGNYLGLESEGIYDIVVKDTILTINSGKSFDDEDIGKFMVSDTNVIYEIKEFISDTKVKVIEVGDLTENLDRSQKYAANQVYLNALKIEVALQEEDFPVVPFEQDSASSFIQSEYPSMMVLLNHFLEDAIKQKNYTSYYKELAHLVLKKAHVRVAVESINNITLQNDHYSIDIKKPFEPFGFQPETGDSFYLANEEICLKKLDQLRLNLQWIKQPASFKEYYKNYWLIDSDNPALKEDEYIITDNSNFKATLFFHDKNVEVPIKPIALFSNEGKINITSMASRIEETTPSYHYKSNTTARVDEEEVLEWDRYFKLELDPIDFQHTIYNTLFTRQAFSIKPEIKSLKIEIPYQPKLKNIQIGYTAYTDILVEKTATKSVDALFHIHPFGFDALDIAIEPNLLPKYDDEGALYLGLEALKVPQTLSILFQMAEGSGNPDVEKPKLQWSYLRNNEWITLKATAIISDSTNGLVNTGVVKISIPADATKGGTLMPEALHWLKISTPNTITGVSDTISIKSQVISATFSSTVIAPSHFEKPLLANTITESLVPIPEIENIIQPFTSSKGKPAEEGNAMYERISERLRHKNRALTMWDYEHMVLNEFPQVYKAKCLPSREQLGKVDVIVIPDIKGKLPFDPFAPKVAADTLFQIHNFLNNHMPIHAELEVINPFYLQVLTRCTVKFYPEYDPEFYKEKLVEEIKRFLSPWAYDHDSDINIGGNLHASVLINFIAERPYIDYVANLKLFQSEDGIDFTDVRSSNDGKSIVIPSRPDMVMVSAANHFIDIVDEKGYDEDSFEGINYMQIQLDFEVANDFSNKT